MKNELFQRNENNPILTAQMWPDTVNAVFNAGVAQLGNETVLLVRVEDRSGISRLDVARSPNGVSDWTITPGIVPQLDSATERWGVEDPRITKCTFKWPGEANDVNQFLITYTGYSTGGPLICLASTADFITFTRRGVLMPPEDKDAALFPVQFENRWALIHRPVPNHANMGAHIWLSFSPDLHHWGNATMVLPAERGGMWDAGKVGLGPPPLACEEGWLLCYHGVKQTASGSIYRIGLAILDRDNPTKVVARNNEWVFAPHAPYEQAGDVGNVVFPCGWILDNDGDTIRMYYGAADTSMGLATASLRELVEHTMRHQR
jgi:predicted GH43/DUF377 family glycosyl hydrolase